jgi:hypothetical protein
MNNTGILYIYPKHHDYVIIMFRYFIAKTEGKDLRYINKGCVCSSALPHLCTIFEVLVLISNTTKKKKKTNQRIMHTVLNYSSSHW